jgi:phage terminase large subunit-like protein
LESDGRRYLLNEIVEGIDPLVDHAGWDAKADPSLLLAPNDYIGLGFDGSRSDDATALVAVRRSDLAVFELGIWESEGNPEWVIPRAEVHALLRDVFTAYRVGRLMGDPWRWENDLSLWAGEWGDRIVEFPTNVQVRMDKAIHRFTGSFKRGDLTHQGSERLTRHVKNAVIVQGDRKKDRGEDDPNSTHYRKLAKRAPSLKIDGAVAAVLALEAAMTMPELPEPAYEGPMVAVT